MRLGSSSGAGYGTQSGPVRHSLGLSVPARPLQCWHRWQRSPMLGARTSRPSRQRCDRVHDTTTTVAPRAFDETTKPSTTTTRKISSSTTTASTASTTSESQQQSRRHDHDHESRRAVPVSPVRPRRRRLSMW